MGRLRPWTNRLGPGLGLHGTSRHVLGLMGPLTPGTRGPGHGSGLPGTSQLVLGLMGSLRPGLARAWIRTSQDIPVSPGTDETAQTWARPWVRNSQDIPVSPGTDGTNSDLGLAG